MTPHPLLALFSIGGGILALVAAAFLLLFQAAADQDLARRIGWLRRGASVAPPQSARLWPLLVSLMGRLGNAMRDRMLSSRDAATLTKTLTMAGFEPSKAMPIFIGVKIACLFGVPVLVYFGAMLLGYPSGKRALFTALSLVVGMMLPNWVMGLAQRPYQKALRRGIPDALDLMVVCAEAGLGLESAIDRVAQETKQSNQAVSVEFLLLVQEMRILPDRRIALTNLAERTGQPALKRLGGTIAQTLKYGTPLSEGLRSLAAEMRDERMIQFEERAGKLPALLVLPMILFILPCLFIILMGQPVSELLSGLGHMGDR
jgi:tight adherence protein C